MDAVRPLILYQIGNVLAPMQVHYQALKWLLAMIAKGFRFHGRSIPQDKYCARQRL